MTFNRKGENHTLSDLQSKAGENVCMYLHKQENSHFLAFPSTTLKAVSYETAIPGLFCCVAYTVPQSGVVKKANLD